MLAENNDTLTTLRCEAYARRDCAFLLFYRNAAYKLPQYRGESVPNDG